MGVNSATMRYTRLSSDTMRWKWVCSFKGQTTTFVYRRKQLLARLALVPKGRDAALDGALGCIRHRLSNGRGCASSVASTSRDAKRTFCVRNATQVLKTLNKFSRRALGGMEVSAKLFGCCQLSGAKLSLSRVRSRDSVERATARRVGRGLKRQVTWLALTFTHPHPTSRGASDGTKGAQNDSQTSRDAVARRLRASRMPWPFPQRRRPGASRRINQPHCHPFQTARLDLLCAALLMSSHGLERRHAVLEWRHQESRAVGTPSAVCSCQWRLCLHRQVPSQRSCHRPAQTPHTAKGSRERRESEVWSADPLRPPALAG